MARTGVTEQAVAEAIESLQKAGVPDPSIRMIHQKLGTGSLTTISQHKRALQQAAREEGTSGLPDSLDVGLRDLADALWLQVSEAADAIIAKRENQAEEREKTATQRIAQAMEELHAKGEAVDRVKQQTKQQLADRDKRIAALEKELKIAVTEQQQALVVAAKAEEQAAGQGRRVDELKSAADKAEKAFAEERLHLTQQADEAERQHKNELNKVQEALASANAESKATRAELKRVQASAVQDKTRWEKERSAIEKKLAESAGLLSDSQKALKAVQSIDDSAKVLLKQFKGDLSALQKTNQGLVVEQRELDKRNGSLEMEVLQLKDQQKARENEWKERLKEKDKVIGELRGLVKAVRG